MAPKSNSVGHVTILHQSFAFYLRKTRKHDRKCRGVKSRENYKVKAIFCGLQRQIFRLRTKRNTSQCHLKILNFLLLLLKIVLAPALMEMVTVL